MGVYMKRTGIVTLIGVCASIVALIVSAGASAHIVVRPAEVLTAGFQTFTVGVPNEKSVPTNEVKLLIPAGLMYVSPTQKAGWQIETETEGEDAAVTAIVWRGGTVGVGLRDDFTFSAKVPGEATELQWKAYQTYADGTIVAWDQAQQDGAHGASDSGPFSVTKVVAVSAQDEAVKKAEQAAAEARTVADRTVYIAGVGVLLGLVAIFLATRRK